MNRIESSARHIGHGERDAGKDDWCFLRDAVAKLQRREQPATDEIGLELQAALQALAAPVSEDDSMRHGDGRTATVAHLPVSGTGALRHEESARIESFISLGDSNIALRVMIYRGYVSDLRPLVILNSVEFLMPPSIEFCELMWANGFQVIFVERPGFGTSTSLPRVLFSDDLVNKGATASTEAVMIQRLLSQLNLHQVVLLGMGSSNPVAYRLSLIADNISYSVYSNVVFNKDILDVFRPKWLQQMFRQMVHSKAGLKIASAGIKFRMRKKPLDFYRLLMHQSAGDVAYLNANPSDFATAGRLFQSVDQRTIDYDMRMSLTPDILLKDGLFAGQRAVAFSGTETPDHWRAQLDSEANRLGIPVAYAPKGDFFAPYASADFFISLIKQNTEANTSTG